MGRGTYADIPRHVNATMRILTMRLFNDSFKISRPFDRLAVESVLYQIFLVTTGLWSDNIPLDYDFDPQFWIQAERLLERSQMYPGHSNSLNSPVLGVPVALYRLAMAAKQQYQNPCGPDTATLNQLRCEIETWEAAVLCDHEIDCLSASEQPNRKHDFYREASYLFILTISLLLDQMAETEVTGGPPRMASSNSWQISKATQILRARSNDTEWKMCFLGNWPIYTLGFFMSTSEGVRLVRAEINGRWDLMKFSQLARFSNDLEIAWGRREFGVTSEE